MEEVKVLTTQHKNTSASGITSSHPALPQ